MAQDENADSTISDVAGLLVAVGFIKESTARIEAAVKAQNGKLDDLTVRVAVMDEWRHNHVEQHKEAKSKQKKWDWLKNGATVIGMILAGIFGRLDG